MLKFIISLVYCCYVVHLYANPILGIFDSSCFVVTDGVCPNKYITFWLYTNETRGNPKQIDPMNLNPWDFSPPLPVKILIHGYTGHRDFAPNNHIRPALLDFEKIYVISIDYGPLVRSPCYFKAVQNLPLVSRCLAQLINNLLDQGIIQSEQLHIIGLSLGGQVAGQTANYVKRKLKHITGLDPARPLFILSGKDERLDEDDAEFVDVIHTDVVARGMLRNMGHVDFYPNFGPMQPGCHDELDDPGNCNHERASRFYAESIKSETGFWAKECSSLVHYIFNLCPLNATQALMGYHINKDTRGSFFLRTAAKPPYALGRDMAITRNEKLLD